MPSAFATAVELRDQLDRIIAQNPNAKIVADVDGKDHAVLDRISVELDDDGDARFALRSYTTGDKVSIDAVKHNV